jgi:hypothetical protein
VLCACGPQAVVALLASGELVVAFRGTEAYSKVKGVALSDGATDLDVKMVPLTTLHGLPSNGPVGDNWKVSCLVDLPRLQVSCTPACACYLQRKCEAGCNDIEAMQLVSIQSSICPALGAPKGWEAGATHPPSTEHALWYFPAWDMSGTARMCTPTGSAPWGVGSNTRNSNFGL